jgi:radical SAM protein with 4Fe4S-binding SPASM domain
VGGFVPSQAFWHRVWTRFDLMTDAPAAFIRLCDRALLRRLEQPFLYDRRHDELYELNEDGLAALARCNGEITIAEAGLDKEFLDECLAEGLLELSETPAPRHSPVISTGPVPSLRYLELQITRRCNLACKHCYLGSARPEDMAPATVVDAIDQFEQLGGLRLLISGGEPLSHPAWDEINRRLGGVKVRKVLLTNATQLEEVSELNVDEVQISLDGMASGHDLLRGEGTFAAALRGARRITEAGLELSIATMAHAGNLEEFDQLGELVEELGAREWSIDAPCITGRLGQNASLAVTPDKAAVAMSHGFGGSYHGGAGGMACGLHLATVGADGAVAKCGFYFDKPLGSVKEGLGKAWSAKELTPLGQIPTCAGCAAVEECGGGCRYRALSPAEPDPVMCALYGQE